MKLNVDGFFDVKKKHSPVFKGYFGLEIIDASDNTPVFCPPLFLFILFTKKGEKAEARKLPGRREGKLARLKRRLCFMCP